MKRAVASGVVLVAVACADPASVTMVTPDVARQVTEAPVLAVQGTGQAIPGAYIVVLKQNPGLARAATVAEGNGLAAARLRFEYNSALQGFAADLSADEVKRLSRDPRVAYIEEDQVVTATATQTGATWGIDRIDQRSLPLSGSFTYTRTGAGVHAYIIDTGILTTHSQYASRVRPGYDFISNDSDPTDCNGHGTHVAGTVGGSTYGVAKGVLIHGVRVLNCQGSGTNSGVIAGVNWVKANHVKPAVANMSLGGGLSSSLNTAVASAISAGVTFAVAAGNSNANACNYSPASVASAITVGATTSSDARASYSNFGTCLDLFAPGSSIRSSWYTSTTATATLSGTSMATPHVAGVAALYLQGNPTASPSAVRGALVSNGTTGKVTSPGTGSPNVLLFTNY